MNGQNEPIRRFPPAESADEDGVVFVGGRVDVNSMLKAYKSGIFPWPCQYDDGTYELLWFSPNPRSILDFSDFHASTRLTRRIRRNEFEFTWNTCFEQVVFECSQPRRADSGIWIIDELLDVYSKMHAAGHAYSIETWQDGQLVGGVFGVVVGDFYSGESMFHTRPDASKAAIVELVRQLTTDGITWLDIQLPSEHMTRMGAKQIERSEFLLRLRQQNFDR